jgi:hypothetical protein
LSSKFDLPRRPLVQESGDPESGEPREHRIGHSVPAPDVFAMNSDEQDEQGPMNRDRLLVRIGMSRLFDDEQGQVISQDRNVATL